LTAGATSGSGGALYTKDGVVYEENCQHICNTATLGGGAMSVVAFSRIVVTNTTYERNRADLGGRYDDARMQSRLSVMITAATTR
jgi:hypothetical protein